MADNQTEITGTVPGEETLSKTLEFPLQPVDLLRDPTAEKARGATWVAKGLVYLFGITVCISLIGGLIVVIRCPPPLDPQNPKSNVVVEAVLPLIQGVGTFASTVFGPLLAFVLGFYFGEKKPS